MERMGPAAAGRLIVDRQGPELTAAMWRLVAEAQRGDPLAPVTVAAPSRYAGLARRQELGGKGFANVLFMELPILSELLGSAALERQGRKPLTPAMASLARQWALSQATGPLEPVREHPNTLSGVRDVFGQLRQVDPSARAGLSELSGVTGEVARLYDDFRRIIADRWYDPEDLAEAATAAVKRGEASGLLDELGLIVFYLPRRTSPGEAGLIAALAAQGRCAVLLGITGDVAADTATLELSARLQRTLGMPAGAGAASDQGPVGIGRAELHIAPNAHEELRWVIRRIVGEVEINRVPLRRMAILYRMADPYAALIRDELRMAGIPMSGPDREPLANSAAGRTLRGLLALSGSQLERSAVMRWLTGGPVRPRHAPEDFNPSRWDAVTRQAGIVSEAGQWQARLGSYAKWKEDSASRRMRSAEIDTVQAQEMREEAEVARNVRDFIAQLANDLKPPAEGSSWAEFGKWAGGLLEKYLDRNIGDTEAAALDRILQLLDGFAAADDTWGDSGADRFRQMVEDLLQAEYGHLGPAGQGVFVSTFAGAAGMDFAAIWLVGMIEGATPPAMRANPLLNESDWLAAGGPDRIRMRMAEERYDYLTAIASGGRRTLSYPVADAASQRPAYPSRWFLEQASELAGRPTHTGDLPGLHRHDWLTMNDSAEDGLNKADGAAPADDHDYRLKRLLEWRKDGRELAQHPFAERNPLAGAVRLAGARGARRLTEYDGNLSALATDERFGTGLRGEPISPTALESWAVCPYRYFLKRELGLGALNAPEETTEISALDRGSLLHDILERFMRESGGDGGGQLPEPGQPWQLADRERLMRIAAEEFAGVEARGAGGKRLLWELAKEMIQADLGMFLIKDAELRERSRAGIVRVETRFGFGRGDVTVVDETTGVRFRGSIDRVDVSADGGSALVIDYKAGSATPYQGLDDDPIDQGRSLQLGVYSLAAQRLYPHADQVRAAYWFATNRGGFTFAPGGYFAITDAGTAEKFRAGVRSIVDGINAGLFPANPGPPERGKPANCRFCEFDTLCPTERSRLWERKQSDPALAEYRKLTGADEEAEHDGVIEC